MNPNAPLIHIEHLHINAIPASVTDLGSLALPMAANTSITARFTKYANGKPVADDSSSWDAVFDNKNGLMWTADTVATDKKWEQAKKAASEVRIGGHDDWRLPTIHELLTLVDYERYNPAIDTAFFKCDPNYYWSSTPYASSPSGVAWLVYFGFGNANCNLQVSNARVRACRSVSPAGQ